MKRDIFGTKLLLFANGIAIHIKKISKSQCKLLELTRKFSKVAGNKINIPKSIETPIQAITN